MSRALNELLVFLIVQQEAEKKGEKEFTCPLCKGKAWRKRSDINNHIHCECEGCGIKIIE